MLDADAIKDAQPPEDSRPKDWAPEPPPAKPDVVAGQQTLIQKYFKPKSLTWWASVILLAAGVVLALSANIPTLAPVADLILAFYPGASAGMLINLGLMGIGLRGAHR